MKAIKLIKIAAALSVYAAALASCTTGKQAATQTLHKEAVLQRCGFKAVPVRTPQQQQQMGTLTPDKISVVQRKGTRYYVFPDPARQMLYVGRDDQYLLYQNYLSNQAENAQYDAISKADPSVAKYNNEAEVLSGNVNFAGWDDSSWGSWDPQ
jgi:hypothetical protein